MRELPRVPTVDEIIRMSEAAQSALVQHAKNWPETSIRALQKNFRAAADHQFREADELEAFGRQRRPLNDNGPEAA